MVKKSKIKKILSKPKAKGIVGLDAVKAISKGLPQHTALVSPGKEGFMDTEMQKEKVNFLEGYSL